METQKPKKTFKDFISYLPLAIVVFSAIGGYFTMKNTITWLESENKRLEQEIVEKEKLANEKFTTLKAEIEAIKKDTGLRDDMFREDAHLKEAIEQNKRDIEKLENCK